MTKSLKDYFPMIRSREEVLKIIYEQKELKKTFGLWNKEFSKCQFLKYGFDVLYQSVVNKEECK